LGRRLETSQSDKAAKRKNKAMDRDRIKEAVISGDEQLLVEEVKKALQDGAVPKAVLDIMIEGMDVVGQRFEAREFFIPEVLLAARAMTKAMEVLKPRLVETGVKALGKVVIGTVLGDLHDIGKNIVAMMLQGAGFEVVDLGRDVPPEKFVEAVAQTGSRVVGLSSLITTSMRQMGRTIEELKRAGLRDSVSVVVGGAPVTEEFAASIGADGYAKDATLAVRKVKELLKIEG